MSQRLNPCHLTQADINTVDILTPFLTEQINTDCISPREMLHLS